MTVTHLASVIRFETMMQNGGIHRFEITLDEMPELRWMTGLDGGVEIPCERPMCQSIWTAMAQRIAAAGGYCSYQRRGADTYTVLCTIPRQ
jgi:hypothetical protein